MSSVGYAVVALVVVVYTEVVVAGCHGVVRGGAIVGTLVNGPGMNGEGRVVHTKGGLVVTGNGVVVVLVVEVVLVVVVVVVAEVGAFTR